MAALMTHHLLTTLSGPCPCGTRPEPVHLVDGAIYCAEHCPWCTKAWESPKSGGVQMELGKG